MSKTLLLSPEENSQVHANMPRGILTIDGSVKFLVGKLRTYNLTLSPSEVVVGIYYKGKVLRASLRAVERGAYAFNLDGDFRDMSDIYFAFLVGQQVVLCGGTYGDSIVDIKQMLFESQNHTPASELDYEEASEEDVRNFFMKEENISRLEGEELIHKKNTNVDIHAMPYMDSINVDTFGESAVYPITTPVDNVAMNEVSTPTDNDIDTESEPVNIGILPEQEQTADSEISDFFDNINAQLDELMHNYPADDELNAIVPDAKFVRITDNESGENYILGIIYQEGEPRYLAYGIPGTYDSDPPEQMKGKCQWLPTDLTDPLSDGYYIIYQDTHTGNLVNIDIV